MKAANTTIRKRIFHLAETYALEPEDLATGLLFAIVAKKDRATTTTQPAAPTAPAPTPATRPAPAPRPVHRAEADSGLPPTQALAASCVADLLK